jgi:hypothetical protein
MRRDGLVLRGLYLRGTRPDTELVIECWDRPNSRRGSLKFDVWSGFVLGGKLMSPGTGAAISPRTSWKALGSGNRGRHRSQETWGPDLEAVRVAADVRGSGALKGRAAFVAVLVCGIIAGACLGWIVGVELGNRATRGCQGGECLPIALWELGGVFLGIVAGTILWRVGSASFAPRRRRG